MFVLRRVSVVFVIGVLAMIPLNSAWTTPSMSSSQSFEVWAMDQSNSKGKDYGGTILIFDGDDLTGDAPSSAAPVDVLDLSGETSRLCQTDTGAHPVRPHMISFNSAHSHAIVSFVASGHIVIFDARTRAPVACLRATPGTDDALQAHAATTAPDDSYILIANQNGKLLERIDADFETETFALNAEATIDLATCVAPSGAACELPGVRPDNAPIVPVIDATSTLAFITLRGGGLFVIDPTSTPMRIVGEYDSATVHGNGFSGIEAAGRMFINSGGGTNMNLGEFDVYAFPLTGYDAGNGPNVPAPDLLYSQDFPHRDAHGMILTSDARYVWVIDRMQNVAEVFETATGAWVNTIDLRRGGPAGVAPDLGAASPSGELMFFSLRGPFPLSGDPHASTGSTPGIGIVNVTDHGAAGALESILDVHNIDARGDDLADVHGIAVRITADR